MSLKWSSPMALLCSMQSLKVAKRNNLSDPVDEKFIAETVHRS